MRFEIRNRPSYATAEVFLDAGDRLVTEGGAMVGMDPHLQLETVANRSGSGGLLGGLMQGMKRLVSGESFFINRYTAPSPGRITLAPTFPGDIVAHTLSHGALMLQSSAFLASHDTVNVDASWGGARSFFGGEGLILLKATGQGTLLFNSFGGISEIEVNGSFVVDTGHIVAFEDTLTFSVGRFGGAWSSFLLGGEGLVCTFSGRGRLWIQGRNPVAFGGLIGPLLPPRQ